MDGEFVNLTPENSGSEHLCCVIRLKTAHPGAEAKRAWLAARFVHVDTLEKAKSRPVRSTTGQCSMAESL